MTAGMGQFGSSSFKILSFFVAGLIYCYTLLVLAVSCMIKNHCIQLDGLLRMRLAFNSAVVVIFRFDWVRQGPIGVLA